MTEPTAEQLEAAEELLGEFISDPRHNGKIIAQFLADREANNGKDNRWPDPLESDIHKFMTENRESIHLEIMDHLDKLQREIDYSRGGKLGPANNGWNFNMEDAPRDGTAFHALSNGAAVEAYYLDNSKTRFPWAGFKPTSNRIPINTFDPIAFKLIELPEVKL